MIHDYNETIMTKGEQSKEVINMDIFSGCVSPPVDQNSLCV